MQQKTIALFLVDLVSGGVQWCMLRLARALKKRGYNVVFVIVWGKGDLLPLVQQEFDVVDLHGERSLLSGWKSIVGLCRFLKDRKPDVLISNMKRENLLAILARKLSRIPTRLIVVEHTLSSFDTSKIKRWAKIALEKVALPLLYPMADEVVAVCRSIADDVEQKMGATAKVKIVYNPVIPENFDALITGKAEHPWLENSGAPVILSIGRLRHEKGFSVLIEAFAKLRQSQSDAKLIILGEGPDRVLLQNQIDALGLNDVVDLAGFKDNIFPWLSASRLFVLPAVWDEPFGLVVVEALACGTPIVSTNGGGPTEILDNGGYGVLVPRGDAQALANAMIQSLKDHPDHEKLRQRGLYFSVDRSAQNYINLF